MKETELINQTPLKTVYFYLTKGCNLACRHCWLNPKHQAGSKSYPTLFIDHFKSAIEQAKPLGLEDIKLTGGEPLLHPEIIPILKYCQAQDISVTIETNGVLCTPELAKVISQCKNIAVSVSLDGSEAKTHDWIRGVEGSFDQALRGISYLVEQGVKPQIIMSLMVNNY